MDHLYTIQSNKQRENFINMIKDMKLPFRAAVREQKTLRSLDHNAYLWGVIYQYIEDYTGIDKLELHDFYTNLFSFKCHMDITGHFYIDKQGTSRMNVNEFSDFIEKVKAHAWHHCGLKFPDRKLIL